MARHETQRQSQMKAMTNNQQQCQAAESNCQLVYIVTKNKPQTQQVTTNGHSANHEQLRHDRLQKQQTVTNHRETTNTNNSNNLTNKKAVRKR